VGVLDDAVRDEDSAVDVLVVLMANGYEFMDGRLSAEELRCRGKSE